MISGWIAFSIASVGLLGFAVWNTSLSAENADLQNTVHEQGRDIEYLATTAENLDERNVDACQHIAGLRITVDLLEANLAAQLEDNAALQAKVERLLDDVTKLAAQTPKHDAKGRFTKRAK